MSMSYLLKAADLSGDDVYRYRLERQWKPPYADTARIVMLNPSTADAMHDDPTIRRCVSLMDRFGYGAIEVFNLFAYRATDPRSLVAAWRDGHDIVGPLNDGVASAAIDAGELAIAAWGAINGPADWRQYVTERIDEVIGWRNDKWHAFAETATGQPRHPLYLPSNIIDDGLPEYAP